MVLDAEYNAFFHENTIENDPENIGNQLYQVQILNNQPVQSGIFFNYRRKCEYCDKEHKDNCELGWDDDRIKLRQVISKIERDLILVAHWRTQP